MNPGPDDTFSLLGPRPEVAPGWLETTWPILAIAIATACLLAWLALRLRRRAIPRPDPAAIFRMGIAAARRAAPAERGPLAARALRAYLAELSPAAAVGLTTEELAAAVTRSPLLVTAADPALRALRAADRAKFAGSTEADDATVDLAELAFANLELARRALWKEVGA